MKNLTFYIALIALLLGGIALLVGLSGKDTLGGTSHWSGPLDSENGYYVNGTAFADASRNISAGTITGTGLLTVDSMKFTGASWTDTGTTSVADGILSGAEVCDYSMIYFKKTGYATTITFDATGSYAAAGCLSEEGAYKDLYVKNLGTGTNTITFAAGTGGDIIPSASSTLALTLAGGSTASGLLRFYASSTSGYHVLYMPFGI